MAFWNRLEKYVSFFEKILLISGIFVILFGSIFRFLSRNFLSSQFAIDLSDIISRGLPNLILLMGLIGASLGLSRNEVIKIDLFQKLIRHNAYRYIHKIAYLLSASLMGVFIVLALKSREFGDTAWISFGYIPGFFFLAVKLIIRSGVKSNE